MPNKKNPDILELIRGRAGRTYGNLVHCLTTLKGLMAGYNSDMQETKFAVVNGVETTSACLNAMGAVVAGLRFDKDKIENELDGGFAQATEIADYLAIMGVPFREAHEKSGKLVKFCEQKGKTIGRLSDKEASGLLGIKITTDKWTELKGFERARLKRKVVLDTLNLNIEKKQIENAYSALLQQ
jgi:argininosuccinate lyase